MVATPHESNRLRQSPRAVAATAALVVLAISVPAPVLLLLVISPVLEEVAFRAGLQQALWQRLGPRPGAASAANLLTALAFAAAHVAVHPGLVAALTLFPALVLGHLYQTRRRLVPCIAVHAAFNATWLLGSAAVA